MTDSEASRGTVLQFCECLSQRDFAGMAGMFTSDATWWVVGRTDYAPYGGLHQATDIVITTKEFFGPIGEFRFTVNSSIAEGDRVAIEAKAYGRHGKAIYENIYLIRFQLKNGKIASIREFFDAYALKSYLEQLGESNFDVLGLPDGNS